MLDNREVQITLTRVQVLDLLIGLVSLEEAYMGRGDEELTQQYRGLYKEIDAQLEAAE